MLWVPIQLSRGVLDTTLLVCLMVYNATFNNISVISWQSVLLVEETRENHQTVASHWQTLSHNVVSSTPRLSWIGTQLKYCWKWRYTPSNKLTNNLFWSQSSHYTLVVLSLWSASVMLIFPEGTQSYRKRTNVHVFRYGVHTTLLTVASASGVRQLIICNPSHNLVVG
jgi:hypothetical protein